MTAVPADASAADEYWMRQALRLAEQAYTLGEVPVGAVLVKNSESVGQGYNRPLLSCDPTAHAEMVTLRSAGQRLANYRFPGTTLYVTVEPCTMCAGALVHARIARLVYGADEPKAGAVSSTSNTLANPALNHRVAVSRGVLAADCSSLLRSFFESKRGK